jgi:hypothetical protein
MDETDDFPAAFESALAALQVELIEACGQHGDWPAKIAAATKAGFGFAAANPVAARALTIEPLALGPEGIVHHERFIAYLTERLLAGREERPEGARLPDITERAMAGGVVTLVAQRVEHGKERELPEIAPQAIQFVLTPYLGAEKARRVSQGLS